MKRHTLLAGLLLIIILPLVAIFIGIAGFWLQLDATDQNNLIKLLVSSKVYVFSSSVVLILLLSYIARWIFFRYLIPLRKLAEDAEILKNSDHTYCLKTKGARELQKLADLISRHFQEIREIEAGIENKIAEARNDLEEEKNILASLIAELNDGIIICNNNSMIVLYNNKAQEIFTRNGEQAGSAGKFVGIGRDITKILPGEIITHALEEIAYKRTQHDKPYAQLVYAVSETVTLRIRVIPVLHENRNIGFILMLHDFSEELGRDLDRYEMMESLINAIRSSVANIRAAIETIVGYKDMQESQRDDFNRIILEEASRMTTHINKTIERYKDHFGIDWPLEQIQCESLVAQISRAANALPPIILKPDKCPEDIWVAVENFSFVNMLLFLVKQISETTTGRELSFRTSGDEKFVRIDIVWHGGSFTLSDELLERKIETNKLELPFSIADVVSRHNARIWQFPEKGDTQVIRILLNRADAAHSEIKTPNILYGSRPEFYDFDLFKHTPLLKKLEHTALSKLEYVVFDAETTGLYPSQGDEIISLAAVRIVNGRILSEQYEQLVDPGRKISSLTTEITGISEQVLKGQPSIESVLPAFHAYCANAVLVAHNAAFDMRFLQLKEKKLGLKFDNPVLDTLLLSASIHENQDSHSLDAIASRFGLTISGRHTALGDAKVTAEILLKLLPMLAEKGIATLEQAYRASQKTYYARITY